MENIQNKKLYRSKTDRQFAGICGGLSEYLNLDSTALRFLWICIVVFTGIAPGVLVYLIGIFVVPEKPNIS